MFGFNIAFVHGKGKRKSEIQKLYDELKQCALKMWTYAIHLDIMGERNSFLKTYPDAIFIHICESNMIMSS